MLEIIQRADNFIQCMGSVVGVDLGGFATSMARQHLNGYLTQVYRTQKGNTYHLCYDYGYLLLPEEKVLIVNWQPYMDELNQGKLCQLKSRFSSIGI
ncbi:hypothetical protein [Pontibacter virosus]|uniref:Uncharacterized protein n=1 Tax=Pontibacter virosus TaxID=1765052 RepID=A0A2U1ALR5_9BACT|nr:hypothetical protein C8E01_12147 [Pontibacter virosus]